MAIANSGLSADLLTENLYLDGDLDAYNNTETKSRNSLLNASAKGTLSNHYLDPVPFINKMAQTYLEARTDEVNMNRENMDYTNDESSGDYSSICEHIAYCLDLNGDGLVGLDDVILIEKIYSRIILGVELSEVFGTIFSPSSTITNLQAGFPQRTALQFNGSYYQGNYNYVDDDYNIYIFVDDTTEHGYSDCENLQEVKAKFLNKLNFIQRNFMLIDVDLTVLLLKQIDLSENGVYLTIAEAKNWIREYGINNGFLNLLMPQYKRRVEIEDLNENFWVIGQVLDAVVTALWHRNGIVDFLNEIINNINLVDIKIQRIENQVGGGEVNKISSIYNETSPVKNDMLDRFDFSSLGLRLYTAGGTRDLKNIFSTYSGQDRKIESVPATSFSSYRKAVNHAINVDGTPLYDGDILRNNVQGNYEYIWQVVDKVKNGTISQSFFAARSDEQEETDSYKLRDDVQIILYDTNYYEFSEDSTNSYLKDVTTQIIYDLSDAFLIPRTDLFQGEMISFGLNGNGVNNAQYYKLSDIKEEKSTVGKITFDATDRKAFIKVPICNYDTRNNYLSVVRAFIYRTTPYITQVSDGQGGTRDSYRNALRAPGLNNIQYISKDVERSYNSNLSDYWNVSMINGIEDMNKESYVRQVDRGPSDFGREIFYESANRGGCSFCAGAGYTLNGLEVNSNYSILVGDFCASRIGNNVDGQHITDFINTTVNGTVSSSIQELSYTLGLLSEARLHYNPTNESFDPVSNNEAGRCYPNISFYFKRRTSGSYVYKKLKLEEIVFNIEDNDFSVARPYTIYIYGIKTNVEGIGRADVVYLKNITAGGTGYVYNEDDKTVVITTGINDYYSGYLISIEPNSDRNQTRFSSINLFGISENSFNNEPYTFA